MVHAARKLWRNCWNTCKKMKKTEVSPEMLRVLDLACARWVASNFHVLKLFSKLVFSLHYMGINNVGLHLTSAKKTQRYSSEPHKSLQDSVEIIMIHAWKSLTLLYWSSIQRSHFLCVTLHNVDEDGKLDSWWVANFRSSEKKETEDLDWLGLSILGCIRFTTNGGSSVESVFCTSKWMKNEPYFGSWNAKVRKTKQLDTKKISKDSIHVKIWMI